MSPTKYIFECSLSGDIPGILCGLCHGGSLSEQDPVEGQRYPVHQACITGNETVVEYLYQNGAKINVSDARGMTPLHLSVLNDDATLTALLLKRGADYKCVDDDNKTPLMYALEKENGNIVTLLKLAKASDEAGRSESVDSQMFMDETMASIYKDFSGGDRDSLKNQSTSSNNSTPSVASSGEEGSKVYVSVATISNSNPVFSVEQKN